MATKPLFSFTILALCMLVPIVFAAIDCDECDQNCQTATFFASLSTQNETRYKASPESWIKVLNKSSLTMPKGAEIKMQFAEIHTAPGAIRETHWHVNSGEWVYITKGTCQFTLMDSEGRFNTGTAVAGDIWYFPRGWQHSFQAVRPDVCDLILWFDFADFNLDITHAFAEIPRDIMKRSLNGIGDEEFNKFIFPLYDDCAPGAEGILDTELNFNDTGPCKGGEKQNPCNGSLKMWPTFPMLGGKRSEVPGAGVQLDVKREIFPASLTMAGGLLEIKNGAFREVHWHPNAEEQHYVLEGKVRVTVYGLDEDKNTQRNTFELEEGDVGVVPINYIHYIEAIEGDAKVIVVFNTGNWETQTLSQTLLTTPQHVNAATFNVTESDIERYFPTQSAGFIPPTGYVPGGQC